jgi:hypothetical protein
MTSMQLEQERARVRRVKEEIEQELRTETWDQAQRRFDAAPERRGNDLDEKKCDELLKTMYWM